MAACLGWWRGSGVRAELTALWSVRHPSAVLDVQLLVARQLLAVLGVVPGLLSSWWLATRLVRWLDGFARPELVANPLLVSLTYTLVLFVAWDLSRYIVHRAMHEIPALWAFHQVHHSAEVLNPLTFHRIHPVESVLYQLRGALVTGVVAGLFFWLFRGAASEMTLFGVHAVGFLLNMISGNLRHSEVWWSFGRWERWLLSPAQHQLHHATDGPRANYGTWLALWDRLGGSLVLAERKPAAFGIPAAERNHNHDLISAWIGPFRDLIPGRRPVVAAAAVGIGLLLGSLARAQAPDEPTDDADDLETVIVVQPDGTPRVAGSAHTVTEAELERYRYDDIGRVLAATPGVYVRDEDGFGLRPNLGIRGANSDRSAKITLLEDGVPIAPAPYAAPAAYYFPMPSRLVGVEVFKGPASTQHGPQTVGGAINLLTRRVPDRPAAEVDLAYGMRGTARLHGWGGTGGARGGLLVEAAHLQSDGFKTLDGGGPTGFERTDLMLKGRLATDPSRTVRHAVELKLGYGSERSHETYLGLHVADHATDPYRRYAASALDLMRWSRTQADLAWQVDLGRAVRVRTVAYHRRLDRAWEKFNRFAGGPPLHAVLQQPEGGQSAVYLAILRGEEDSSTPEQTLLIGTNDRTLSSFGVQSTLRWRARSGVVDSRFEAGIRVHGDIVDRLHTEDPYRMRAGALQADDERATLLDARSTATALALYAREDLALGGLHLIPGLRVEGIRTAMAARGETPDPLTRFVLLPGMAVLGEPFPRLQVFAGVHRGFSPVAPGQPEEVAPESSWNTEAGVRMGDADTRLEVVGFVNDYQNITGQCTLSGGCEGDDIDRQFNGGKAMVAGLEGVAAHALRLPGRITVPLQLAYTYTQGRFRTGFLSGFAQFGSVTAGDGLPYMPAHQLGARLALSHPRFGLAVGLAGRTGMRDAAGHGPLGPTDIPAQALLDLSAEAHLDRQLTAYATVMNATGSQNLVSWRPYGARPTAPLQVMVGLRLRPGAP